MQKIRARYFGRGKYRHDRRRKRDDRSWVQAWPWWLSLIGWVTQKADQPSDALRPHPLSTSEAGKPPISPDGRDRSEFRIERRSDEHTSELQSLMSTSYAVFC